MTLPKPAPGLVIHYNYLWQREAEAGRENGRYARPCAIVVVATKITPDGVAVMVSPITHSPPTEADSAIELPAAVKRALGLDDQRSWLMTDEVNAFAWPGYDLDYNRDGKIAYGVIPGALFARVKKRLLEQAKAGRLSRIVR